MLRIALVLLAFASFVGCGAGEQGISTNDASAPDEAMQEVHPLGIGESPPSLDAEGWLNGNALDKSELAGKVVVIDVWAFW